LSSPFLKKLQQICGELYSLQVLGDGGSTGIKKYLTMAVIKKIM